MLALEVYVVYSSMRVQQEEKKRRWSATGTHTSCVEQTCDVTLNGYLILVYP